MATYTPTSIQALTKKKVPTIDQAAPAVAPGGFEYSSGGQASMNPNIPAAPVANTTTPAATPTPTTPGAAAEQNFMGELDRIRQEALKIQGMLPGTQDTSTKKGFAMPGLETGYPSYEQLYPAVNEDQIYRKTLKGFQQQINATNKVYDQLLRDARLEGEGRLGTQRAAAARGGLIGSDFGMAQEDKVVATNAAERQALQAQRSAAIGAIMGTVRQTAVTEAENKRKAIKEGAESYIGYLKSARERKLGNLTTVAKALIAQGIDPNTMTPDELKAIADEGGINPNDIITQYNIAKSEADSAAAEADLKTRKTEADIAKIEADIASGKLVTLGEGTMLYNTETGETMKNPKTYAPETGDKSNLNLTPEGQRTLLGGGWNESDIQSLQAGVREYGLQTVIEQERKAGATPTQIAALEKAYKTSGDSATFLNQDYFRSLFGEDKLKEAAKEAGALSGTEDWIPFNESGDSEAYLNQLMATVDLYRQAGYTDQEILKMMQ